MTGSRKSIPAALEAALWTVSNGRCYAPGCPFPVVVEVRPGVYKKNAQIAHVYGVRPNAARYRPDIPQTERDSFKNLLLLCLPHHSEVDDKRTGEKFYPPELLYNWKAKHEGANAAILAQLGPVDENQLMELIVDVFEPPIKRLEAIADQLERTGTLNATSMAELRRIVDVLRENPIGPDPRTVGMLVDAVSLLGGDDFPRTVAQLQDAAATMARAIRDRNQFM